MYTNTHKIRTTPPSAGPYIKTDNKNPLVCSYSVPEARDGHSSMRGTPLRTPGKRKVKSQFTLPQKTEFFSAPTTIFLNRLKAALRSIQALYILQILHLVQ